MAEAIFYLHTPLSSPSLASAGAVCISMQVKNICLLDPPSSSLAFIRGSAPSLLLPFHERRRSRRRRRSRSRLKTFAAHLKTKKFSRLPPHPPPLGGGVFSTLAVRRRVLHWRSKKTTGTRGGGRRKVWNLSNSIGKYSRVSLFYTYTAGTREKTLSFPPPSKIPCIPGPKKPPSDPAPLFPYLLPPPPFISADEPSRDLPPPPC